MNRIKRLKRRKKVNTILMFVFIVGILLMVPAYAYMREQLNFGGKGAIVNSDINNSCSGNVTYDVFKWGGPDVYTYKLDLKLTNTGDKDYNFWDVYFDVPSDASIVTYSSTDVQIVGTQVKASNVSYNGYLSSGSSASFEIQISTSDDNYEPTNFVVKNCDASTGGDTGGVSIDDLEITYNVVGSYGNYTYQYDVIVKNVGTEKIDAWNFSIIKPANTKVVNIWGANYITGVDVIEFSNASYTGTIDAGSSITFGLIIETDIQGYIPSLVNE